MNDLLTHIAACVGGAFEGTDTTVVRVTTDSRRANLPEGTLFVAIRGTNRDGHDYIEPLYRKGVRAFIVDGAVDARRYPEAGFVRCDDSVAALQRLAACFRDRIRGKVVAITGSNGKTVTKEWIAQLCPPGVKLFRSPKSYNSQIGVPLSLLMTAGDEQIAVIEAGISRKGEMQSLERIVRPDIGIITNIGDAHQENFDTPEEKAEEKLNLFAHTPTIIYNAGDPLLRRLVPARYPDRQLIAVDASRCDLNGLPYPDAASRENAAEALTLYGVMGYDMSQVRGGLRSLQNVAMRLELKDGINGCKIVNDSYNSDINSLGIALEYLSSVAGHREKTLILSDIDQSGLKPDRLYAGVAELLKANGVTELIGIGEEIFKHAGAFDCRKEFYLTTENFLRGVNRSRFSKKKHPAERRTPLPVRTDRTHPRRQDTYDRAGSQPRPHDPQPELLPQPAARRRTSDGDGQGIRLRQRHFRSRQHARTAGRRLPGRRVRRRRRRTARGRHHDADRRAERRFDSFDLMLDYRLEPEIYSRSSLQSFAETVRRNGETDYPIHIKLDTGMHRLGFERQDIDPLIDALKTIPELYIRTIFTHLAGSDEARHDDFTRGQIALFRELSDRLVAAFPQRHILRHVDNSAGIERFPEAQFDMVRLGIGLYGISVAHQEHLLPVSALKSRIVQIKEVPVGDTVGYGRHGIVAEHPVRTATVPIGYADGLNRRLSCGKWSFIVNGRKAPIIGNICMDTCMIDITGIDAHEGDTVTVFGEGAPVGEMADVLGTIPYEIMTGISTRVKRIYTKE